MNRLSRLSALILFAAIALVTLCPIAFRPETGHPELERSAAYCLFGIALAVGFPRHPGRCAAAVLAVSAVLESLQLVDPGRDGEFGDFVVKAAAGIAGILLVRAALALYQRLKSRRNGQLHRPAERQSPRRS